MLTDYEISSKYLGNIILGWELIKLPIKSEGNKQPKVQPPPQKKTSPKHFQPFKDWENSLFYGQLSKEVTWECVLIPEDWELGELNRYCLRVQTYE